MNITRIRVVIGDLFLLAVLVVICLNTKVFRENVLAITLVLVILLARSIYYHVMWYKATGKFY